MTVSVAGCGMFTAGSAGPSAAPPSPTWHILSPSLTRRHPAAGVLVVTRQLHPSWTCLHRIYVDDEAVADLRSNEIVTIYAPLGVHVLSVRGTSAACPGFSALDVDVVAGTNRSFTSSDRSATAFDLAPDAHAP